MDKTKELVLWFKEVGISDVGLVGGKNASLGDMFSNLSKQGINVPNGFAVTAYAYQEFLEYSKLREKIDQVLKDLDTKNLANLQARGKKVRQMILQAPMPPKLAEVIEKNYSLMAKDYGANPDVAVRSSATAEDLPGASFAGQQETYLNVRTAPAVIDSVKRCFASLFTDRAISYRQDKGFSHFKISLSVAVQKMVRSDISASGVAFTLDTESGFDQVVVINGIYGLGEFIVQGKVIPDEYVVFKPTLAKGFPAIISRKLGRKNTKLVYGKKETTAVNVPEQLQKKFCLTDKEVLQLANWCVAIEKFFSEKYKHPQPMDIEWAKDGQTGKLFIVQARPETVHSMADKNVYTEYRLSDKSHQPVLSGVAVGSKIATGKVKIIKDAKRIQDFRRGEILVTEITDPDWEPIMKIAGGIITDKGGRTSHAAIVSRELGIPCIVGSQKATKVLKNGEAITMDSSSGTGQVYRGTLKFETITHHLDKVPKTRTQVMVNIGSPEEAFKYHYLPVSGVGLGRLEFIIMSDIQIHPNALIDFQKLKDKTLKKKIEVMTYGYTDKREFYVDRLAEGIARIGAAFYPNKVIVRFSDFKTNEYRTLLGGENYEPKEENPMIGWRGASRYYDPKFAESFKMECRALKMVHEKFGLTNVIPMVPFCRTVEEGQKTLGIMKQAGLKDTKVYVMCEIPSNVLLAEEFLNIFDGMSIGSNDLTQLTLGLDRDSGIVSKIANENDPAVKKLVSEVIKICRARNKYIGICGQAPSDYPDFAKFLVSLKIDSISLSPDTVIPTTLAIAKQEGIK